MPSRPFPARATVTPLTSNNHCGHCRKHPETPGLSQYKPFIKKSADIHTYQRDAPVTGADESLVAEHSTCLLQDLFDDRSLQFCHVVMVTGNRLGNECYAALKVCDYQG
jgi:hypothetical protein